MSTSQILPTLIHHPTRVFSQWYSSVSAFAASIGTADFTYGMVHLVISQQAWAALPGNTAQNGDVVPFPTPQPPGALAGNASAATVHLLLMSLYFFILCNTHHLFISVSSYCHR